MEGDDLASLTAGRLVQVTKSFSESPPREAWASSQHGDRLPRGHVPKECQVEALSPPRT